MWLYVSSYISFQHLSAQKPSFILLWWLFEGRIPIFGVQNPKKLPLKPSCIQICHDPHEPKVEPILHPPGRLSASVLPSSMALDRSSIASSSRPQDVGCWSMSQPTGMSPQRLERKQRFFMVQLSGQRIRKSKGHFGNASSFSIRIYSDVGVRSI